MSNYTLNQMGISEFWNFWFLTSKNKIFDFLKINTQKIKIFTDIQKTGVHAIELSVTNMCAKFQANIFIFGCAIAQKPSNSSEVSFLRLDFWNF